MISGSNDTTPATDERGHTPIKHENCDRLNCMFCDGGLDGCAVCGGLEGAMPTNCPGVQMTAEQIDDVYAGKIDYRYREGPDLGERGWVDGCSVNSPAQWSGPWEIRLNGVTQCTLTQAPGKGVDLNIFRGACYISTAWPNRVVGVYHRRSGREIFVQNGNTLDDKPEATDG